MWRFLLFFVTFPTSSALVFTSGYLFCGYSIYYFTPFLDSIIDIFTGVGSFKDFPELYASHNLDLLLQKLAKNNKAEQYLFTYDCICVAFSFVLTTFYMVLFYFFFFG